MQQVESVVDLPSLPLPAVRRVLGQHVEVETKTRTKYVVGALWSVNLDGFDVAREDGLIVHVTWNEVKAALVKVEEPVGFRPDTRTNPLGRRFGSAATVLVALGGDE